MKYDAGKKHVLILVLVLAAVFIPGAAAQTATVTDADSNLTDSQIDVEFTEIPSEEDMVVESIGSDGEDDEEVVDFTSESGGTAIVNWRHNPFEANTNLSKDGWDYRVTSEDSDFEYDFHVRHGNMLLGLDTFEDQEVNDNLWSFTDTATDTSLTENDGRLHFRVDSNDDFDEEQDTLSLERNFSTDTTTRFRVEDLDYDADGAAQGFIDFKMIDPENDEEITSLKNSDDESFNSNGLLEYKVDDGEATVNYGGEESSSSYNGEEYRVEIEMRATNEPPSNIYFNNLTAVPRITDDAFDYNRFNPSEEELTFPDFIVNQDGTAGLEFSNDSNDWSSTPPDSGESLYYRNVDDGTLDSTAVDTSELFGGVDFTALEPRNESTFIIDDGEEITQDFYYEVLYTREDCSDYAGIQSTWRLYERQDYEDGNFDDTIDESTYPDNMDEDDCEYFRDFEESVDNLGAGDYVWTFYFRDNDIDREKTFENEFSLVEESDAPVKFDLQTPEMGEEYNLSEDETLPFEYNVEAEEDGDLDLIIPQYDDEVRYEESITEGNNSNRVNLKLDDNTDYEWWLEYTRPETTTTTGDDGVDGFEDGNFDEDPNWSTDDDDVEVTDEDPISGDYSLRRPASGDLTNRLESPSTDNPPENWTMKIQDDNYEDSSTITFENSDGEVFLLDFLGDGYSPTGVYWGFESDDVKLADIEELEDDDGITIEVNGLDYEDETVDEILVDGDVEVEDEDICEDTDCTAGGYFTYLQLPPQEDDPTYVDDVTFDENNEETETNPAQTFASQQIEFFTLDVIGGDDDDDGDDDDEDDEDTLQLGDRFYQFLEYLGFTGQAADLILGTALTVFMGGIGFRFGRITGGAVGLTLGILIAGLEGFYPGWIVFTILVIASYIMGRTWQEGLSD